MGLFAISELLNCGKEESGNVKMAKINRKGFGISRKEFAGQTVNFLRSSFTRTWGLTAYKYPWCIPPNRPPPSCGP